MKKTILLLIVSIFGLLPLQANAAKMMLMFGAEEKTHLFEGITMPDSDGKRLYLGHLVRTESFLLPYSVKSKGYILASSESSRQYIPLSATTLKELQNEGLLQKRLPPIELTFFEYLFGNLLWIALAVLIVPPLVRGMRRRMRGEESVDGERADEEC